MVIGRKDKHQRSQRVFKEAIIKRLLKDAKEPLIDFNITILKHHEFVRPSIRILIKHH
jgi:hypothetical protein